MMAGLGCMPGCPPMTSGPIWTGRSAGSPGGRPRRRLGWWGVEVEAEVASGMTGRRPKLRRLLADPAVQTVVVTRRDRLARMNAELVEAALWAHGRRLVVLDDGEVTDDLIRDMVEALTSFCARLYGRRSARNRALEAVRCAERDVGPAGLVGAARDDGDRLVG